MMRKYLVSIYYFDEFVKRAYVLAADASEAQAIARQRHGGRHIQLRLSEISY